MLPLARPRQPIGSAPLQAVTHRGPGGASRWDWELVAWTLQAGCCPKPPRTSQAQGNACQRMQCVFGWLRRPGTHLQALAGTCSPSHPANGKCPSNGLQWAPTGSCWLQVAPSGSSGCPKRCPSLGDFFRLFPRAALAKANHPPIPCKAQSETWSKA